MTMSNVMNQSAPRTSWLIVSSRTGLDSAVSSAAYALSREVSRAQSRAERHAPDPLARLTADCPKRGSMRSYVRYTFWAAVAAVVTGIVAMLVTWFAR